MLYQHWIKSFGRQRGEHKLTKVVVVDLDTISQYHFNGFMTQSFSLMFPIPVNGWFVPMIKIRWALT